MHTLTKDKYGNNNEIATIDTLHIDKLQSAPALIKEDTTKNMINLHQNNIHTNQPKTLDTYQTECLKQIITESMQELKAEFKKDLQNLHLDMLRQFHLQQVEIAELFEKYCAIQSLLDEIKELHDENRRLRNLNLKW